MYLSLFPKYLLFLCFYLISQSDQSLSFWLLLLLSSTFHGKLLLLPFLTVKSPSSTCIFFFLFLSWSNNLSTISTNLHHKNHKNKNPPTPQESKPTSTNSIYPQAPISVASTNLSLYWFVCVGVFMFMCIWGKRWWGEGREKKAQNMELIK